MQLVETKLPEFPYGPALSTILAGEMGSIFEPLIESGKVEELADKPQIAGLKASLELPAKDYLKAMRLRRLMQDEVSRLFGSFDVLLAPGRAGHRDAKIDQPLDRGAGGTRTQTIPASAPSSRMGNLAGLPALVLPCGFAENMPVALQLVGVPVFGEHAARRRPRIPVADRLAQAPSPDVLIPMPAKVDAKRWYVRGRVQGVGYRNFAQRAATELGLTGYARNLDDGRVEVYAVGPVDKLSKWRECCITVLAGATCAASRSRRRRSRNMAPSESRSRLPRSRCSSW